MTISEFGTSLVMLLAQHHVNRGVFPFPGYGHFTQQLLDRQLRQLLAIWRWPKHLCLSLSKIPNSMYPHFIRGVFDGDGTINARRHSVEASICSRSLAFLEQVRDIINDSLYVGYEITRVERRNGNHYYSYRVYGVPNVTRFGQWIYADGFYGMNRKKREFIVISEEAARRKLRGAYWKKDKGKWRAQIKVNGKCDFLGYFDTEVEAAMAYDREAAKHHGRRAILNFPELIYGDNSK